MLAMISAETYEAYLDRDLQQKLPGLEPGQKWSGTFDCIIVRGIDQTSDSLTAE